MMTGQESRVTLGGLLVALFISMLPVLLLTPAIAQNPTVVRPTNGVVKATAAETGVVYPGLRTNNRAAGFFYRSVDGGPNNFDWAAGSAAPGGTNTQIQYNNVGAFGGFGSFNPGNSNIVIAGSGAQEGTIALGNNQVFNRLLRDSSGTWGVNQNVANVGWTMGVSLGLRNASTASGNTTIQNADGFIQYRVDASAGPFTLTLPNAAQNEGKILFVTKIDDTTNRVTIASSGGNIDNFATDILTAPRQAKSYSSDNALWRTKVQRVTYPKQGMVDHSQSIVDTGNAIGFLAVATMWKNGFWFQNAAATNDTFHAFFALEAGTYTYNAIGTTDSNRGIQTLSLVDELGRTNWTDTVDWYNAINQVNVRRTTAAFLLTNSGNFRMISQARSRNASSSDFNIALQEYGFQRVE